MKQRDTNCIPIDEITHTIHSVYIPNCKAELSSTVSLVYTQIHVVYREPRRRFFFFVADINKNAMVYIVCAPQAKFFWKYIVYAYLHRHTRITWNRTSYA